MNVFQMNVRLAEGGAANVALLLHEKALENKIKSYFIYGYGKGLRDSSEHQSVVNAIRRTHPVSALINKASFDFLNVDLLGSPWPKYLSDHSHSQKDVIHMHVAHSYWMNFSSFYRFAQKWLAQSNTLIWTLHDHWAITGRCAFLDGCNRWKESCYSCPKLDNYPPVRFDNANRLIKDKQNKIRSLVQLGMKLVSPSKHLANDVESVYGDKNLFVIPNSIQQSSLDEIKNLATEINQERCILTGKVNAGVIANDLSYEGKTNRILIQMILEQNKYSNDFKLHTIGKNSPFKGPSVVNHGFISSKSDITRILSQLDCMIFSSKVDNYPLIICECLCLGIPVLAVDSSASREILNQFNIKPLSESNIAMLATKSRTEILAHLSNISSKSLSEKAIDLFSPNTMFNSYMNIYK